jgi:hypothetical protein
MSHLADWNILLLIGIAHLKEISHVQKNQQVAVVSNSERKRSASR